jgi:hypothetical protein
MNPKRVLQTPAARGYLAFASFFLFCCALNA